LSLIIVGHAEIEEQLRRRQSWSSAEEIGGKYA
jgi:hypothetical protein